jgi:hypothetical protein
VNESADDQVDVESVMSHISGQKVGGPFRARCDAVSALVALASIHPQLRDAAAKLQPRVATMALPLPPGLTPPEIAFLCEMELVTVIPRQRLEGLELLGVCVPHQHPAIYRTMTAVCCHYYETMS